MSVSLVERVGLSIPIPLMSHDPLENEGGVLARLLALASFARQLDPSLPNNVRAYRHVPEGGDPQDVPFKVVFTTDNRSRLPNGVVEDQGVQEFWEVMDRLLPDTMAADERRAFAMRVQATRKPPFDVAMADGHRAGSISLVAHERGELMGTNFYTNALAVHDDQFMDYPDLATRAFITPSINPSNATPVGRMILRFQAVCETLSQPFETTGMVARQTVAENIRALDASQGEGTFEENHRHGWAGYALARGGKGWTGYLVNQVGVSPHAHYGKFSPLALAVGGNDRNATVDLLDAEVSPNTVLRGWPRMFAGKANDFFNANPTDFLPIGVFAAGVGSVGALGALLERGGDPNFPTEKQDTPLHLACQNGDEAAARLLDAHAADFTLVNDRQHVPDELIPNASLYNSFHHWAQLRHDQQVGRVTAPAQTLGERVRSIKPVDEVAQLESIWVEPARPVGPRRSRSNP